jgi:hypothetical protein
MWMATLSGHRRIASVATVLAAAALVVGPLLHAPSAYAKDGDKDRGNGSQTDGRTVNFTGGSLLSMLLCRSEPSEGGLTIPAESRVMFVNRLGQKAVLRVNGKALVEVGPDHAVPVLFHYGPVSVSMTFSCGANVVEQFSSTSVVVTPVRRPDSPPGATPRPTMGATVGATPSVPAKARTSRSGRSALSPAQPGTGAHAVLTADSSAAARSPAATAPSAAAPSPDGVSPAGGSPDSGKGGNAVAVEPLVRVSATPRDSSSGLLALLAAACAVGVTIAVIRAIISKRTIPANYA